jgi:hypothetical protein
LGNLQDPLLGLKRDTRLLVEYLGDRHLGYSGSLGNIGNGGSTLHKAQHKKEIIGKFTGNFRERQ